MGKITRRGSAAVAVAAAAALAFSSSAGAVTGDLIDVDGGPDGTQPDSNGPTLYRFAGQDRIATSIQAAERTTLPWGDTVIIANNQEYADALAAAPLADMLDAPVIVDRPGSEPSAQVKAAFARNSGVNNVILASGTSIFDNDYVSALEDDHSVSVERFAGANRYQTALILAEETANEGGYASGDVNIFLADGRNFPDALAAGAAAADNSGVVMLTKGSTGIDRETFEEISYNQYWNGNNSVIAVGGPAAASAAAGNDGTEIGVDFTHIGDNRYETAVELAETYYDYDEYDADATHNFVLASGERFPDAVVGGAFAANVDGPLLLTKEDTLTNVTSDFLENTRADWAQGFTFGGPDSVSIDVTNQLAGLTWSY